MLLQNMLRRDFCFRCGYQIDQQRADLGAITNDYQLLIIILMVTIQSHLKPYFDTDLVLKQLS